MRYSKPKNIQTILDKSSIGYILRQSQKIDRIMQCIDSILPKTFQGYYLVKNYEHNILLVAVVNGTIRYGFLSKQQELLQEIQKQYPEINQIKLVVDPSLAN